MNTMPEQQGSMLTVYLGLSLLFVILCLLSLRFPAASPNQERGRRLMAAFLATQAAWYLAFFATLAYTGQSRIFPTLQDGLGFMSYTLTVPMFHAFANRKTPLYSWVIIAVTLLLAVPITAAVPGYVNKVHVGNVATLAIMVANIYAIGTYTRVAKNPAASVLWYMALFFATLLSLRSVVLVIDPALAAFNESFLSFTLPLVSLTVTILILASVGLTAQQHLITMALRDQLTGLRNRHALMQDFQAFAGRLRRGGPGFAFLVCDIDHFKQVNDRFSHESGDRVLAAVAEGLGNVLRDEDIAARIGGEEFVLLLNDATPDVLEAICERLLEKTRAIRFPGISEQLRITTSIGAVIVDDGSASFEDVFRQADKRLYEAKAAGRDRFVI